MQGPFFEFKVENFHIQPFQPLVFRDYKPQENFPNCCPNHKAVMEWAAKFVEEFPNCCEAHKILAKNPLIDLTYFKSDAFAVSIVNRVSYTEHHIEKRIEQANWYEDITNYIEYIISSFGTPSFGDHVYSKSLISLIEARQDEIGQSKAQRLIDYVNGLYERQPDEPVAEEIDLNELYHIYQKWLFVFPFTVQPFDKLKDRFTNIFPVIAEEPVYNPYTQFSKFRVVTKRKLIEWLIDKTKEILKSVNSVELLQNGLVKDTNAHRVDLLNGQHKARQAALVNEFSKQENHYLQVITKWLSNEEKYYKAVMPLLAAKRTGKTSTPPVTDNRANVFNERMHLDEVRKYFIQLAKNSSKNGNPFLTIEQFEQFINRAFVGEPFTEKLSMNEKTGDKGKVIGLFYLFFTRCTTHQPKIGKLDPNATVEKYIRLLTDHFDNWTFDEVKNNFRSGGNWQKPA
ncbi:hypothetical protein [Spirosoma fluviale]|uniref:Uncharacterized protein n=1 Tax=Spirosoma fluviale TaxID=1597977 RepID=A0A286GR60_9BACT|nr:hypothetical protein [Spirosoma fluviale]SOD98051.1 hypothetical protein SAMN06269250_6010 [Spirosoma fluviale]